MSFYTDVLGLKASYGVKSEAIFSPLPGGPGLIVFTEDRNALPRPRHSTGLYHFALRYATRTALAHAYTRLVKVGYPVTGASDHGVSEAIYLSDPDGNGIELYTDRARSQWHWHNGQVAMMTTPLDLENLLASIGANHAKADPSGPADLGHIHLHVGDLGAAERFYNEFLGLAVTQRTYPGALFFAAGGYHHHIAANVWAGKAVPPPNSSGLVSYRLEVPITEILYCLSHRAPVLGYETRILRQSEGSPILQICDPNQNWLEVQASTYADPAEPNPARAGCPEAVETPSIYKKSEATTH